MNTLFYNAVMSVKDSINAKKAKLIKLEYQFEITDDRKELRKLLNDIGRCREEIDVIMTEYKEGLSLL